MDQVRIPIENFVERRQAEGRRIPFPEVDEDVPATNIYLRINALLPAYSAAHNRLEVLWRD
jgi:hypothetical protein